MSQQEDVMDRPQEDRPQTRPHTGGSQTPRPHTGGSQTPRPHTGGTQTPRPHTGGSHTDTPQVKRLYPWSMLHAERCESVELDHSIREHVQSHRLTQNAPERTVIQAQSGASAPGGVDPGEGQVAMLEKQRHELLYVNQKWAEQYQAMTQYYKQKVHKLKQLLTSYDGQKMKKEGEEESDREEGYKVCERDVPQSKDAAENIQEQNVLKAESEAKDLRVQNLTLTRRGQQRDEEIKRLNKALRETIESPARAEEDRGTQEQLWRHQARVYKEDFLTERRDREKLKEKHTLLEERFRKVHTELNTLRSQVTWTPTLPRPPACVCPHGARLCSGGGEARPRPPPHHPHHHPLPHNNPSS